MCAPIHKPSARPTSNPPQKFLLKFIVRYVELEAEATCKRAAFMASCACGQEISERETIRPMIEDLMPLQIYLFSLDASFAQTARMAASSPRPVGHASLGLLAKYQRISAELAVRPPGISR